MIKFSKENNLIFHILLMIHNKLRGHMGCPMPDPFLSDLNRILVFHGKINDAMEPEMTPQVHVMENNIKRLLDGKSIEKDFDPSIGCSIKWKS